MPRRLYKIESLELFRKHGLPILDYEILEEENAESQLRKENSRLLDGKNYAPFTEGELDFIINNFYRLENLAGDLGIEDFVASLSYIEFQRGKPEPIFWDFYKA
jgi:hypothetical protein